MNSGKGKKLLSRNGNDRAASDLDVLERMLDGLGVVGPRAVAKRLLERFGGFGGVFGAAEAELMEMGLSAREGAFFAFVNPAIRRVTVGDGSQTGVDDERTAVSIMLSLFGNNSKTGLYAVYFDKSGHKICSEYLGEQCQVSTAAIGACRHRTKKLLVVCIKPDGEVTDIAMSRAAELSDLTRLLDILEIKLADYMETDGTEFFSMRRAIMTGTGTANVFDASEELFCEIDFVGGIERYVSVLRAAKLPRKEIRKI